MGVCDDGTEVAVKCLPKKDMPQVNNDLRNLRQLERKPNIVKFKVSFSKVFFSLNVAVTYVDYAYLKKKNSLIIHIYMLPSLFVQSFAHDACYVYLALELCEYNLLEYVGLLSIQGTLMKEAPQLMWGVLSGVAAMHSSNVLHMDLKVKSLFCGSSIILYYDTFSCDLHVHDIQWMYSVLVWLWVHTMYTYVARSFIYKSFMYHYL